MVVPVVAVVVRRRGSVVEAVRKNEIADRAFKPIAENQIIAADRDRDRLRGASDRSGQRIGSRERLAAGNPERGRVVARAVGQHCVSGKRGTPVRAGEMHGAA